MRYFLIPCIFALLVYLTTAQAKQVSDNWVERADSVCQQLSQAADFYAAGNVSNAHLTAVMTYFKNYDVNIEPTASANFGQAHVFDLEQQFNSINKSMVDNPTAAQITSVKNQINQLCQSIKSDSTSLDKNKVPLTPKN